MDIPHLKPNKEKFPKTAMSLTDDQLLRRFVRDQDQEAFRQLIHRHAGMVLATCRRELGDATLAEDASQAVFLLLSQKAKGLQKEGSLASWLFSASRLICRNLKRQNLRREHYEVQASMRIDTPKEPDTEIWDDLEPRLNLALSRLKEADQKAILLRYIEGQSQAEVATALGVTENTARMRIQRSVERLRRQLSRLGMTIPVAALCLSLEQNATASVPLDFLTKVSPLFPAGPAAGAGATASLAKGATIALATTSTKIIATASVALVLLGGGMVYSYNRPPVVDDAENRAFFQPMIGNWQGTLTYRDYQSNQIVKMEMRADLTPIPNSRRFEFRSIFPGDNRVDSVELELDPKTGDLLVYNPEIQRNRFSGRKEFIRNKGGKLVMTVKDATDGGQPVEARELIEIRGDQFTFRREVRIGTQPFQMRNEYSLRRVR